MSCGSQRAAGADLRRLLAEQRDPDRELALTLQSVALPIEPAHQHHVAIKALEQFSRHLERIVRVGGELTFRVEQLNQVLATAGGLETCDDLCR